MKSAEECAYRYIVNAILTGVYNPGDFLLEQDLAAKLQVSRTPITQALTRLVSEGLLNKAPKKGCYIPIPTAQDADLVFYARQVAESAAAAKAAETATEKEMEILKDILRKDRSAFENGEKQLWAIINEEFHLSIAKFSHNSYLEKWVKNIFWRSTLYVFYFDTFYKPSEVAVVHETPEQHRAILNAILERDASSAFSLMCQHVNTTYSKLLIR